ncbi:MAG: hypothetical protein NVS4B5_20420 [Vulcanimicrobiaceae bacterium]
MISTSDAFAIVQGLLGARVGFYEGAALASVRMYSSAAEAWRNWPRSLPLRDASTTIVETLDDLAVVVLVQALPLAIVFATLLARGRRESLVFRINVALALARVGVLVGTRRAYGAVSPAYWLALFTDLPCALRLVQATFARTAMWRGRTLVTEGTLPC